MKRTLLITAGIVGALIGLGFVFPAVAQMQTSGALPNVSVGLLLFGLVLTAGGGGAACYGFRRRGA